MVYDGAGHHARLRRRQPTHQRRNLFGLDQSLDRTLGQHHLGDDLVLGDAVGAGLIGDLLGHQRCSHIAGVDAVAGDAVRTAFQRGHLRQPFQAVLGGDVGDLELGGAQTVYRRDVDDPAESVARTCAAARRGSTGTAPPPSAPAVSGTCPGGKSAIGLMLCTPALLTRMSASSSRSSSAATSRRSTAQAFPPISSASDLAATSSTSATVTRAPRPASSRAQAAPIPLAPPVTTAVRPVQIRSCERLPLGLRDVFGVGHVECLQIDALGLPGEQHRDERDGAGAARYIATGTEES